MTSSHSADRSGSRRGTDHGTERMPRIGAGVAEPDPDG
jgi:hypothetical protein